MQLRIYDTAGDALRVGYDAAHHLGFSVSSTGVISIKETGTERGRITGGVLAWGTTTTSGAGAGDVILAGGARIRSVFGGATYGILRLDTSSGVQIAPDGTFAVQIGAAASVTGATAGDLVLGNAKWVRGVVAAGTSTVALVSLDSSNRLALNANSLAISITNPSTATTVGAAGAASALPSAPTGYLVVSIAGTNRKIPYYAI